MSGDDKKKRKKSGDWYLMAVTTVAAFVANVSVKFIIANNIKLACAYR